MKLPFFASIGFTAFSGVYWCSTGQLSSIVAPMMLDDRGLLLRVVGELLIALAIYMVAALVFFRWLIGRSRTR